MSNLFKRLNQFGKEILSRKPTKMVVPIRRPASEHQRFRQWLDAESKNAAREGKDTYEEFMDFGPEDVEDYIPTPYETVYDPLLGQEIYKKEKEWLDVQRHRYEQALQRKREDARRAKAVSQPRQPVTESSQESEASAPLKSGKKREK